LPGEFIKYNVTLGVRAKRRRTY